MDGINKMSHNGIVYLLLALKYLSILRQLMHHMHLHFFRLPNESFNKKLLVVPMFSHLEYDILHVRIEM